MIEIRQREMRKKEAAEMKEWERRYFSRVSKDPVFEALAAKIGEKSEPEKTGGIWKWDPKKYQATLEKKQQQQQNASVNSSASASGTS